MAENKVYWYTQKKFEIREMPEGDHTADVVVVGGGMAGLMCAYRLAEEKKSVILLERDFCGSGASGKTSGFITPDSEIELSSLLDNVGPENAKRIWEFVLSGVNKIRETIEKNFIACDYRIQDSLFIANDSAGFKHTGEEHEARRELGYASTFYDTEGLKEVIGSSKYYGAVRYPETFGINSYLYCQAMKEILLRMGVRLYEGTNVSVIDNAGVTTERGQRVTAGFVAVACDRFLPDLGVFPNDIYHVQTFLGISERLTDAQVKAIFPKDELMVWDTDLVYNYYRMTGENRILLGGGDVFYTYRRKEATDAASSEKFAKRLTRYFSHKFPGIPFKMEYVWPGMLGVSKDLLPMMGPDKRYPHVWYVGAATGLPWAAALGTYLADKAISGRDDFDKDFSPYRKFIIGDRLQALLTTPATYAISHGIAKYL